MILHATPGFTPADRKINPRFFKMPLVSDRLLFPIKGIECSRSAADASRLYTNIEVTNDDTVSHKKEITYDSLKKNKRMGDISCQVASDSARHEGVTISDKG
jgi:hypothetical protein